MAVHAPQINLGTPTAPRGLRRDVRVAQAELAKPAANNLSNKDVGSDPTDLGFERFNNEIAKFDTLTTPEAKRQYLKEFVDENVKGWMASSGLRNGAREKDVDSVYGRLIRGELSNITDANALQRIFHRAVNLAGAALIVRGELPFAPGIVDITDEELKAAAKKANFWLSAESLVFEHRGLYEDPQGPGLYLSSPYSKFWKDLRFTQKTDIKPERNDALDEYLSIPTGTDAGQILGKSARLFISSNPDSGMCLNRVTTAIEKGLGISRASLYKNWPSPLSRWARFAGSHMFDKNPNFERVDISIAQIESMSNNERKKLSGLVMLGGSSQKEGHIQIIGDDGKFYGSCPQGNDNWISSSLQAYMPINRKTAAIA